MKSERLQQLFQFLKQAPNDSFTLYSIAYEYLNEGDVAQALEYFTQLRMKDPEYVGLYYHLGKAYEQIGEAEEAFSAYDDGLRIAQRQHDLHAFQELQRAKQQALDEMEDW
jgi:predicted Zn-dependent protease